MSLNKNKMTSEEQRLSGITDMKLKLLDLLIIESIKKGGALTTEYLRNLKKGLGEFAIKQEVIEKLK